VAASEDLFTNEIGKHQTIIRRAKDFLFPRHLVAGAAGKVGAGVLDDQILCEFGRGNT
jgi:hypothetical protein